MSARAIGGKASPRAARRTGSGSGSFPGLPPPSPDNFGKKKLSSSGYGAQTKGKYFGGFITKQDLDSPSRVAIKLIVLVSQGPLLLLSEPE